MVREEEEMEDLGYRWRKRIAPGSLLVGPWVPKCSDDVCAGRDQVVIATTSEGEVVGDWACLVGDGQCHKDMDAGKLGRGGEAVSSTRLRKCQHKEPAVAMDKRGAWAAKQSSSRGRPGMRRRRAVLVLQSESGMMSFLGSEAACRSQVNVAYEQEW
jgi:hypothetical protein